MRERDMIIEQFRRFVEIIRDNNLDELESVLGPETIIEFSTVGKHQGIENIKQALTWNQKIINKRKAKAGNFAIRHAGNKASMISYVYFCMRQIHRKGFIRLNTAEDFTRN